MYFWKVLRGAILLLSYMVFHSLAYNSKDNVCVKKHLILFPKEIYKKCNVIIAKDVVQKAPTVKVPADANLRAKYHIMILIDPDAFNDVNLAYPHWVRTHITNAQLKSGITPSPVDEVPFKPPSPFYGRHRYQFLLYPQSHNSIVFNRKMALRGRVNVTEFEKANAISHTMGFQYVVEVKVGSTTSDGSDLIKQRISSSFIIILIYFGRLLS